MGLLLKVVRKGIGARPRPNHLITVVLADLNVSSFLAHSAKCDKLAVVSSLGRVEVED